VQWIAPAHPQITKEGNDITELLSYAWWLFIYLGIVLVLVWIMAVTLVLAKGGPKDYKLTKAERRSSRLPGWIPGVVSRPVPEALAIGPHWGALERKYGTSVRLASRWNDSLTALPMIPAMGILLCGVIQLVIAVGGEISSTSGKIEPSSWLFACVGIFALFCIPFVATYAVHDKRWRVRAPFEWLYVKQCLWLLHHLQIASKKGEHRMPLHALDSLERLLVNRFLPPRAPAPPSLKRANDWWHARIQPLISEKAVFYGSPQDIQTSEAVHKWIEKSAELVSIPVNARPARSFLWGRIGMPRSETSPMPESGLREPYPMHYSLGIPALITAMMFGFALLYESVPGVDSIRQGADLVAKIVTAVATVVPVAALYLDWKHRKN
jgi:hypothetical protein